MMKWVLIFLLSVNFPTGFLTPAQANDGVEVRAASAQREQYERDVDAVAMASQNQAIAKLTHLLRRYRNTSQEPVLLAKLAELQQQNAAILFRLANGRAHQSNGAVDLSRFKKGSLQTIHTLNELIAKFPSYSEIAHAYYMRGRSYEDIEDKTAAAKDYNFLVSRFPMAEDAIPAYMSLADFAIDANDHPKAIRYLKEVEKHPDDPHYPFALYKLAWSYYNLKDIPTALHYAETQIYYYDQGKDQGESDSVEKSDSPLVATSDNALRENTLLDSTVFYFEGYEEDAKKYSPENALEYFHKLEKGPVIGRMLLRYSKLLRSHAHDEDLIRWKNMVMKEELSGQHHPETLDIVLTAYEHIRDRRNWNELMKAADDIVTLYNEARNSKKFPMWESMPKAQKTLLDTAQSMQAMIVKNKDADGVQALSQPLASIYFAFVKVVDDKDPRIPGVHYNLAETLFAIRDYDNATAHYRWVVEHGNWKKKKKDTISVADASLKAIASRYETLQKDGLLPKEVTAVSLAKDSKDPLNPKLQEWIGWIDEHLKHTRDKTDNFVFEADRAIYAHGHIAEAVQRMSDFAEQEPKSKYAIPSASLVIDTYIATGDWAQLLQKAESLQEIDEWKGTPFNQRLFAVAADASYKLIEQKAKAKDYAGAIDGVEHFLKTYSKSERLGDALTLAGMAAMDSHQDDLAVKYFTRLIKEVPNSKSVKDALIARARIEEAHYQLGGAAQDYRAYLKVAGGKPDPAMQKKILALLWVNGDWAELKAVTDTKASSDSKTSNDLCTKDTQAECARYVALGTLVKPDLFHFDLDRAFDKARKESGELSALWSIVSLQDAKDLAFRDRLLAIRHLCQNWDELDPLVKLSVLPYINDTIPNALAMNRKMMNEVAPLKASEKYITHRVDVMREMENAVTATMRLPWARIKAGAMNELAGTYIDFSQSLAKIEPKGLEGKDLELYQDTVRKITIPFDEKGEDLRGKAFQLASQYAIETAPLHTISDTFFADNPSQAKRYRKTAASPASIRSADLNLSLVGAIDSQTDWEKINAHPDRASNVLAREFVKSLHEHNWPKLVYLLQDAKEKSAFSAPVLTAMRAVSMASLGAQAEGLLELEQNRSLYAGKAKLLVLNTLSRYFELSFAEDRAQSFQKEIEAETAPKANAAKAPTS